MPKDSRTYSLRTRRASPYYIRNAGDCRLKNLGDEKEWEEARCPICMEHPHSAVLLLCASHQKGCRPYVCNTGPRHSNCLHQFLNSPAAAANPSTNTTREHDNLTAGGGGLEPKYLCPLCRGEFTSWMVVEPARKFMNAQKRSCSLETCDFSGTYAELRNHANRVHPSVRPSEADPGRVREWTRLEQEREFEDLRTHSQDDGLGEDNFFEVILMAGLRDEELMHIPAGVVGSNNATSEPEMTVTSYFSQERTVSVSGHSQVHAPNPPRQSNFSGQSGGGVVQGRNFMRTTARMSVRYYSGLQLASRHGEEENHHTSGRRISFTEQRLHYRD